MSEPRTLSLEGHEGTGKTTLAYTAPLPIVGFSFDMGTRRALSGSGKKHFEGLDIEVSSTDVSWVGHDITVFEMVPPIQMTKQVVGCIELWESFLDKFIQVLDDRDVATVVIDTATLARRLRVDAHLQVMQQAKPGRQQLTQIEYGIPNTAIRNLYNHTKAMGKNLVLVHHLMPKREETVKDGDVQSIVVPGQFEREGLSDTNRYVDWAIRLGIKEAKIVGQYMKCGDNLALLNDTTPDNPTWDSIANQVVMSLGGGLSVSRRGNGGKTSGADQEA